MEQSNAGFETENTKSAKQNNSVHIMEQETGKSSEALVDVKKKKRNRMIILGGVLLVIVFVIAIIIVAALKSAESNAAGMFGELGEKITVEDFIENRFEPRGFNGSWLGDGFITSLNSHSDITVYDVNSGKHEVLVPGNFLFQNKMERFKVSPTQKYVLFSRNVTQIFRYSTMAIYYIYEVQKKQLAVISIEGNEFPMLDYASWITGTDDLLLVYKNNIFIKREKEDPSKITQDGDPLALFNGVPDWVYQEEILASDVAMWTSPKSNHLAYIKFDDKKVDDFQYTIFDVNTVNKYPITNHLRYPRPGRTNPTVSLHVAVSLRDPSKLSTLNLEPPQNLGESYIFSVVWISETSLAVHWVNRHQNDSLIVRYKLEEGNSVTEDTLYSLQTPGGWLETENPPVFSSTEDDSFLIIAAVNIGMEAYQHVVMVAKKQMTSLSTGRLTAINILHWDEQNHVIYFVGSGVNEPGQRHVYRVHDLHHQEPKTMTCLTCSIKNSAGQPCLYNAIDPSPSFQFMTVTCQGPFQALEVSVYQVKPQFEAKLLWNDNKEVKENLTKLALPKVFDVDVKFEGGDHVNKVKMFLPPDFDASKVYPMIVNTYAGPNSQQVSEKWFGVNWGAFLASGKGIIYTLIDGRGSGFKGNEMLFEIYRKLGTVESDDQIAVTKYLRDTYSYIDKHNIGIWGWSYGGYNTARILAKDKENVFKCGVSVAPVTDWRLYDSVYTERYMGLPKTEDNLIGYLRSDLVSTAKQFENKTYMLVHGTADDNVHYQQSMLFAKALEEAVVMFKQLSYPDETHGLRGVKPHLYRSMLEFWEDCFALESSST